MSQTQQSTIEVNGESRTVSPATTLREIVEDVTGRKLNTDGTPEDGGRLGLAAAVSGTVIPRGRWHTTDLPNGAVIDVVTAAQGG